MATSRRTQARDIVQRGVLALIPRATAEGTTVTVERHFTQLGQPAKDSWTGDVAGFAMRIAIALYGPGDQDETDDLQTGLRDQLGEALIAAGAVPATMPIEVLAQAGVLADAVLPVTTRAQHAAVEAALAEAARLFDELHKSRLDGGIMTANTAAELLRSHAADLTTGRSHKEKDTSVGSQPTGAASTPSNSDTDTDRDQVLRDMARQVRAISKVKGWSLWAADYMDPDVEFLDTGMPPTADIIAELRSLDRAAVLREAADTIGRLRLAEREWLIACGLDKAEQELRRMAAAAEGKGEASSTAEVGD